MNLFQSKFRLPMTLAAALMALALSGCNTTTSSGGPGGSPGSGSSSPSCKTGETLVGTECKPIDCSLDKTLCPNGTRCNASNKCEIIKRCESSTACNTGICSNGACLNPERCISDRQCLSTDMCDTSDFKCKPSVCPDACRNGGVCDQQTKQCKDAPCNPSNERNTCTTGKSCVGATGSDNNGKCMTHGEWENTDPCQLTGGVPAQTAFTCVDAENCLNDDQCTGTKICHNGKCQTDSCANGSKCANGICDKATQECVNKTSCTYDNTSGQTTDCLNGYTCIYDKGTTTGTCVKNVTKPTDWCKEIGEVCSGNQTCNGTIDSSTNYRPSCEEPTTCTSTLDCLGDKRCFGTPGSETCQAPTSTPPACTLAPASSKYDTPEAIDEATDYSLCAVNDAAFFKVPLEKGAGEVYVDLNLKTLDVGAGALKVELLDPNTETTVLASKELTKGDSQVSLSHLLRSYNNDEYLVLKVSLTDALQGGLTYKLKAGFTRNIGSSDSCVNAQDLTLGTPASGDTRNGASGALIDCNDTNGSISEEVWHFSLQKLSKVNIFVNPPPGSTLHPVVSLLKGSCYADADTCEDHSAAEAVQIEETLDPGDYFVVVSSDGKNNGGEYNIVVNATPIDCKEGQTKCVDNSGTSNTMVTCKADGTWQAPADGTDCGGDNKCDATKGVCEKFIGGTCQNPIVVDFTTSNTVTKNVEFKNDKTLTKVNHYGPRPGSSGGCGGTTDWNTGWDGGERVYQVDVPPYTKLTVNLKENNSGKSHMDTVLMLFNGCPAISSDNKLDGTYCIDGKDGGLGGDDEGPLVVTNDSGETKTYFVYADFDLDSVIDWANADQYTITFEQTSTGGGGSGCKAGELKCETGEMKVCNSSGTWDTAYECSGKACKAHTIDPECVDRVDGDSCDEAQELHTSTTFSTIPYYVGEEHDFSPVPTSCKGMTGTPKGGREVVFKYTADKDGVATFTVKHAGFTPLIWLADSCDTTNGKEVGACLSADNSETDKGDAATPVDTPFTFLAVSGKTYYIVVEPSNATATATATNVDVDANFTVKLELTPQSPCTPNTIIGCGATLTDLEYCDADGFKKTYDCTSLGANFACDSTNVTTCVDKTTPTPQPADRCFDADFIDATSSTGPGTITGTFSDLNITSNTKSHSAFEPHGKVGECYFRTDNRESTNGGDRVYAIKIPAKSELSVDLSMFNTLTPSEKVNPSSQEASFARVYFLKNCLQLDSCVGSKKAGPQTIYYRSGNSDETIYLVLDSTNVDPGLHPELLNYSWTLTWRVDNSSSKDCIANQTTCNGNKVVECTAEGKTSLLEKKCLAGQTCEAGSCTIAGADAGRCSDILDLDPVKEPVSGDLTYYFNWDPNDGEVGGDRSLCGTIGKTISYSVTAKAGQWIDVDVDAANRDGIRVHITTECSGGTCLDSTVGEKTLQRVHTSYLVPADGTYYISIASKTRIADDKSPRYGKIALRNAACNSTTPATCSGGTLQYCSEGRNVEFDCGSGNCDTDHCINGTGDICLSAVPLSPTDTLQTKADEELKDLTGHSTIKTTYGGSTNNVKSQMGGSCIFYYGNSRPDSSEFPDKFYSVALKANDTLHVDVTMKSNKTFYLYLLKSCGEQSCVADDFGEIDTSGSGSERKRSLDYKAKEAGNYIVVVKAGANFNPTDADKYKYDIKWKVTPESPTTDCTPFTSTCTSATDITVCNVDNKPVKGTCFGTCSDSICKLDKSELKSVDSCKTAPTIDKTGLYMIPFYDLTDSLKNGFMYNGEKKEANGKVANFKVSLKPHQSIRVYFRSSRNYSGYQLLRYNDCGSIFSSVTYYNGDIQIKYGKQTSADYLKAYEYVAGDQAEEFFLGAISDNNDYSPARVFVEISSQDCDPDTTQPTCSSPSGELKYCSRFASYDTHTCVSGCDTDGKLCAAGDGDTCQEAIKLPDATVAEQEATNQSFSGKHNSYSMSQTCTGFKTEGNDVVYALNVKKGKELTFTLEGVDGTDGSPDLALYLTTSCGKLPNACVAGVDVKGPPDPVSAGAASVAETLTYTPTQDGILYVIVDSYWKGLQSNYTLTYKVAP